VEQNPEKGVSFVFNRMRDLREMLAGAEVRAPRALRGSGGFVSASEGPQRAVTVFYCRGRDPGSDFASVR
jgi:hypothetical protein